MINPKANVTLESLIGALKRLLQKESRQDLLKEKALIFEKWLWKIDQSEPALKFRNESYVPNLNYQPMNVEEIVAFSYLEEYEPYHSFFEILRAEVITDERLDETAAQAILDISKRNSKYFDEEIVEEIVIFLRSDEGTKFEMKWLFYIVEVMDKILADDESDMNLIQHLSWVNKYLQSLIA